MAAPLDADTFIAFSDALQAAALTTTRLAATSLPADLAFHRSIDLALTHDIDVFSDRVLSLANRLVRITSENGSRIREEEDVVDEFVRNVVDPMEDMLESTDGALDVFLGRRKEPAITIPAVSVESNQNNPKKHPFRGRLDPALTHASHIPKPQLSFKYTAPNTDQSPYIPATLIPHKWCAKVPLGYVFHDGRLNQGIEDVLEDDSEEERRIRSLHPYYYELTHLSYPGHVFNPPAEPPLPPSLDTLSPAIPEASHSLTFVSTPKALLSMANALASVTELAVDLEHHSYRSSKGFLALMQISTRRGDFVVDLLAADVREGLRQAKSKNVRKSEEARIADEAGQIIAKVFADPSIIKVFHGAESDIVWLQQDFNIFVVGLFDTFHASKLMEFPKHSLAYLLETFCNFIPDKRYQLADWRIRPLPTEMLNYARSDTHFLLYIYDMLRLSLIKRSSTTSAKSDDNLNTRPLDHEQDLIRNVLMRSSRTALRLYEIEVYDAESGTGTGGWDTLARKWNKLGLVGSPPQISGTEAGASQAAVYKAVHRWRENVAREEDESTRYVLPTHHLFLLAERAPVTIPDLLSLFGAPGGANGFVPPVLKRRIGELVAVLKGTIEADGPKSAPQRLTEARHAGAQVVASPTAEESETMSSTISRPTAMLTNESRLWTSPSSTSATAISISHSALFGTGNSGRCVQAEGTALPSLGGGKEIYSATGSVMFGSALCETTTASSFSTTKSTFARAQASNDSIKHFHDIMQKIHNTLVIAPVASMPSFTLSVLTQASETSQSSVSVDAEMDQRDPAVPIASGPIPPGPEGQIEIPFVPAHERQTLSNPPNHQLKGDAIVVVGQTGARQRKRKRDKAKGITLSSQSKPSARLGGAEPPAPIEDYDQEVEAFDYSGVPNLLDDETKYGDARGVQEEERRKKKQRHGKGSGLFEYGDFRAPPRDQREVRSGNKTYTFR